VGRLFLAIVLAATAPAALAQTAGAAQSHIGILPVVANTIGVNEVNWRSEVALQNNSNSDVEVLLAAPGAPGSPFFFTSLSAGQTIVFDDVVRDTFGLDSWAGPLVVQTFGSRAVAVSSVVRALAPHGEAAPQVIPRLAQGGGAMSQVLRGLEVSDTHRTNVGLTNLGDEAVQFALGLQVVSGRFVETASITVGAFATVQQPLQEIFPVLARGSDLIVVVEPASRNGFAYASVIENASSNGRFVLPSSAAR
jgi:hypothetical protein